MDEEITIIDTNTRNKKIIDFFKKNKIKVILIFSALLILLVGYLSFVEIKKNNKVKLASEFSSTVLLFEKGEKQKVKDQLIKIVKKKDTTYSPLALYFLIDNNLIENENDINILFDILINETNLKKEIKNLIIYKKALFNSNLLDENSLIKLLNPIINSESIWKSHSLFLMGEYFFSKKQENKSKEYFQKILSLENANQNVKVEAQKRLNRDLGE
jgi:predicted negative regulator of RcsB-dependent stress response